MTPETKAMFEKTLNDPNVSNEAIVMLFNSLNSGDNMANTSPELFALFAKAFMDRNIDLRDHITEVRNSMKITKKQLKRIIREEYLRLQKKGLINEMRGPEDLPYGNVTGEKKPAYNIGPKGHPTQGSIRQYLAANYGDFIDMYIRTSSSPERFWDMWEMHCEDNGIPCTQDHLVALVDRAEQEGEIEEGELFIGDRGF